MDKIDYAKELLMAVLFGILGRAIYFVRHDTRPLGLKLFLYEIPIAVGFGIMGGGIAQWLNLTGMVQSSVMIASGYIGPRIVDILVDNLPAYLSAKINKQP